MMPGVEPIRYFYYFNHELRQNAPGFVFSEALAQDGHIDFG